MGQLAIFVVDFYLCDAPKGLWEGWLGESRAEGWKLLANFVETFNSKVDTVLGEFINGGKGYVRVSMVFLSEEWVDGKFE